MSKAILFTESSPNVGGQELQLMQQMQQLAAAGYQPVLACRPGSRVEQVALQKGLSVLPVRFRNSVHLPSIAILRRWLATHRPRLAVCHSGHDSNNLAIAARLVRQRPFLLRSRTYQPGKASAWSYNTLVDATMLPSQYLRDCLLQNPAIRADKLHVVYPGIDFERIARDAGAALPSRRCSSGVAAHPGPLLVHAAMLRGEKGHQTILEAMARLQPRWPQLRYIIAGEGPEAPRLQAEILRLGPGRASVAGRDGAAGGGPASPRRPGADAFQSYEPLGHVADRSTGPGSAGTGQPYRGYSRKPVSDGVTGQLAAARRYRAAWAAGH